MLKQQIPIGFEIEEQATRTQIKASIQIEGLSGTSKTGTALIFAYALAKADLPEDATEEQIWLHVGMGDTEKRSANLYVNDPITLTNGEILHVKPFRKANLTDFKPQTYEAARDYLIKTYGIKAMIFDSYTHAWVGEPGGVLSLVSEVNAKLGYNAKDVRVWNEPIVANNKKLLVDLMRNDQVHMITTIRVKEAIEMSKDEQGKTKVISAGLQQIMQDSIKYEPDLGIHMISPGQFQVYKSRYSIFKVGETYEVSFALADELAQFLKNGVDPSTLLEQRRQDYIKQIRKIAKDNASLRTLLKTLHPDKKTTDFTLDEAKEVLKTFGEVLM